MKKIRLLIYDGDEQWLKTTLSNSVLKEDNWQLKTIFGTISAIDDLSEITDIIQRMNQQIEVDSSVDPTEAI